MMGSRREFLKASGALVVCFTLPGCGPEAGTYAESQAAPGELILGNRIEINADGRVILYLGKVELGQGIGTALAQIAAEELGIKFSRMQVAGVDTDYSPDESYTFSTISVQKSGPLVREAAATGRHFLLKQAAQKLDVPVTALSVVDGDFLVAGNLQQQSYWQLLAGEKIELAPDEDSTMMPVSDYLVVGESVQRLDIPGIVFGEEYFLQDIRLPGMVHARVVRPTAERAQLLDFDPAAVAALPGVRKVVRDGNFVAVIAEREGQARNAAAALSDSISWSVPKDLPPPEGLYNWLRTAPSRLESVTGRVSAPTSDIATRTISAVYQRPYLAHASISPSAAIALFEEGKLTIWSHAQGMYPLRTAIAHTLGLQPDQVRCIHKPAAGCYGHNGADDAACDAAALAMQFPGKPVRLQWERADEFAWEPNGSAMHIETRAELDQSGMIRSWDFDLWSCPHTSRPRSVDNAGFLIYAQHRDAPLDIPPARSIPQPSGGADRNAIPLYEFDNTKVSKHLVTDVPIRVSALRSLGAYGNVFAIESFMDELALAAGQDPLLFRIAHLQDDRAVAVLEMLATVSDWSDRPAAGSGEGWGIGFARFKNMSSYLGVVYKLKVDSDQGRVRLLKATAVCDAGLVINPDGVRAQIEGGIIQSSSWTLKEQVRFDESGIKSRDWAGYPILRFDEVPDVQVHLMSRDDQPSLGVGETAQGPTAASIANAVFHAGGRRFRRLPLTPERIADSASRTGLNV